ncbi:hypothetical protein L249_3912 [Ophiocordyceps polyrhachis-furcata BCC 54312]|uniref:Uncharacterized protein n=1 Tax=Ophiocordyceps polyrhachis-furcata BCC 54312 TaxID=1330021 RepID=A0A367L5S5_9HYPO|nr:hypothetical protein L249_3912 [Ophiocordyceps polyrhachis-furcata BCC 54312]
MSLPPSYIQLLRKACRRYHWCSVVVKPGNQYRAERIPAMPKAIKLSFVHQLHLRLDECDLVDPRCLHWIVPPRPYPKESDGLWSSGEEDEDRLSPLVRIETLRNRVLALLSRFRKDQLMSFSWELGTCLPVDILQRVADRHNGILSLRLATDGHCKELPDPDPIASVKFRDLESFAWSGITDPFAATCFVHRHRSKLRNLDLAMSSHAPFEREKQRANDGFANHIWKENRRQHLAPGQQMLTLRLNRVQKLTLSRMAVADNFLITVFDLKRLQSLTLRDCPGWNMALVAAAAADSEGPIALKTLEIQSKCETWRDEGCESGDWSWLEFFRKTVYLKKFYLGLEVLREENAARIVWEAIDVLCDRLVELVVHFSERSAFEWWPSTFDVKGAGIFDDGGLLGYWNPFNQSILESLGIACVPKHLISLLKPFAETTSLRFLHVRQTKSDVFHQGSYCYAKAEETQAGALLRPGFLDLASWAFGPRGIHSLETIAFGDFASNRPSAGHSLFLVRDHQQSKGYTIVQPSSDKGKRLLSHDKHRRVLSSCPLVKTVEPQHLATMTQRRLQMPPGFYDDGETEYVQCEEEEEEEESDLDIATVENVSGLETPIRRYLRITNDGVEKRRRMNGGFYYRRQDDE